MINIYSTLRKQTLLFVLILLGCVSSAQAQVPQFFNYNAGGSANSFPLNTGTSNKVQWIYAPAVFNSNGTLGGTPAYAGNIIKVYFRVASTGSPNISDFTISLAQNLGTQAAWLNTTYNTGMTQVYYQAVQTMTGLTPGLWYGVTLQTPFLYDPTKSLIFEMKATSSSGTTVYQNGTTAQRIWGPFASATGNGFGSGLVDFGFDMIPATPCTGQPTAGSIVPGNSTVCAGQTLNLSATGSTLAGNMTYQWQQSINGGTTWTSIGGATNMNYQTPTLTSTIMYRFIINCIPSGLSDTTAPITITVAPPSYASLPYSQDFETWANYCNTNDVPADFHWTNSPQTGNDSWRREDQGGSANWTNATLGMYNPPSTSGIHSARFHSYSGSTNGILDLYVDCSSSTGSKTLVFDYINNNATSGTDFLQIEYSTNGGSFFIPVASFNSSPTWTTQFVNIPSNTANTIIRFNASGGSNFVAGSDIGVDNVFVLAPCTGTPIAGAIAPITPCANQPFTLSLIGSVLAGGLNFTWESAPAATGPWTFIGGSAGPTFNTTIATPTYFRCIVTCPTSGLSDTTAPQLISLGSFYVCYCQSQSSQVFFENVGNVLIADTNGNPPLINNGNPLPAANNLTAINTYSNFTNLSPANLYKDSVYDITITGTTYDAGFTNSFVAVYIDFNRDGVYDPVNERILATSATTATAQKAIGQFLVPANAIFGLTGMRVVLQVGASATTISPCGVYNQGETEDYVVNIAPAPCNSPPNAGYAITTDTATCPGTAVVLSNTTYDKVFGNLTSSWQTSSDGVVYNDILGGNVDTITVNPVVNTWYRFRVTCNGNSDGYSNVIKVNMLPTASCFGLSATTGTLSDTSDLGAFVVSTPQPTNINLYTFSSGGPHLNNANATRFYTNYTPLGTIDLYTDSTYKLSFYHTMRTFNHADAQITMFIDYNNNKVFDLPDELVYTGIADINNYFLNATVKFPQAPAINEKLACRIVLNNDVNSNTASSTGYGTYISGETEDYFVRFKVASSPNGVQEFTTISGVSIYPNPASGYVSVGFLALESTQVNIDVLNVTGAKVFSKNTGLVFGNYSTILDLKDVSKGVYLLKFTTENGSFVRKLIIE